MTGLGSVWSRKPAPSIWDNFRGAGQRETGGASSGKTMGTEDTPINNTDLSQERRADPQVLGDHIKAEEVPVDASPRHGQAVHVLVLLRGFSEEILEVCFLGGRSEAVSNSPDPQGGMRQRGHLTVEPW